MSSKIKSYQIFVPLTRFHIPLDQIRLLRCLSHLSKRRLQMCPSMSTLGPMKRRNSLLSKPSSLIPSYSSR